MRLPFRIRAKRYVEVQLDVEFEFKSGRLADLVQLLARSQAVITDLEPDRSLYHVGMPERSARVVFLAKTARHKVEILEELAGKGFAIRELTGPIR